MHPQSRFRGIHFLQIQQNLLRRVAVVLPHLPGSGPLADTVPAVLLVQLAFLRLENRQLIFSPYIDVYHFVTSPIFSVRFSSYSSQLMQLVIGCFIIDYSREIDMMQLYNILLFIQTNFSYPVVDVFI